MLTKVRLQNFRCFDDHSVPLRSSNVVVGKNNAGKSSFTEALRLLSLVTNRFRGLSFSDTPYWLKNIESARGMTPSLKNIDFNENNVFHFYKDAPAIITGTFSGGESVKVYIGENANLFAIISQESGVYLSHKAQAKHVKLPKIRILPQISALQKQEKLLGHRYVESSEDTSLSSLHFRNQILIDPEHFDSFVNLARASWNGLDISPVELNQNYLSMLVREGGFSAEIGAMGHGLQMWLQTMWFLAKCSTEDTVVLDEPDVYMHADLQRRLIRLVKGRYSQVCIATHSVEIMSETPSESVLMIDRSKGSSRFADSIPAVQNVVASIGGVHNIQLTRLVSSNKCLFLEGKDMSILTRINNVLYPNSPVSLSSIPHWSIGGWHGLSEALGGVKLLQNAGGDKIVPYCILDRDYYTAKQITKQFEKAANSKINLHIWKRKEIENYLLVPSAIARIICHKARDHEVFPTVGQVCDEIDRIVDSLRDDTLGAILDALSSANRSDRLAESTNLKEAQSIVSNAWINRETKWSLVSGKTVISRLSQWSQKHYGVSINPDQLAEYLMPSEVPEEMRKIIEKMNKNKPLNLDTEVIVV